MFLYFFLCPKLFFFARGWSNPPKYATKYCAPVLDPTRMDNMERKWLIGTPCLHHERFGAWNGEFELGAMNSWCIAYTVYYKLCYLCATNLCTCTVVHLRTTCTHARHVCTWLCICACTVWLVHMHTRVFLWRTLKVPNIEFGRVCHDACMTCDYIVLMFDYF